MATPPDSVCVLAATRIEAWAARYVLPREVAVLRTGIGLRRGPPPRVRAFVSCGLAGALSDSLAPGAVVVPRWVGLPSGERLECYPPLVEALARAARELGCEPVTGPMLTAPSLVTGRARREWAGRGFVAVDMETGLLLRRFPRGAAVRVVLDTPERDLSAGWERPARALLDPTLWPQAARMGLLAPACALRAAEVVRRALGRPDPLRI